MIGIGCLVFRFGVFFGGVFAPSAAASVAVAASSCSLARASRTLTLYHHTQTRLLSIPRAPPLTLSRVQQHQQPPRRDTKRGEGAPTQTSPLLDRSQGARAPSPNPLPPPPPAARQARCAAEGRSSSRAGCSGSRHEVRDETERGCGREGERRGQPRSSIDPLSLLVCTHRSTLWPRTTRGLHPRDPLGPGER